MNLSVRECKENDIQKIVDYFHHSDEGYLRGMGVEVSKLPSREDWINTLKKELAKPYKEKELYYVIWLMDNEPVGHSNVNFINFGKVANMHLHVWDVQKRQKGMGVTFLQQTIPMYFEKFQLKKLLCEPFGQNIPPNKTLQKFGFSFLGKEEKVSGPINFLQEVSKYELSLEKLNVLKRNF